MQKRSSSVALGGLAASICLVLMLMTGAIPFTTYAFPALAGMVMIAVIVEQGRRWAAVVYVGVSILSLLITPDRSAAVMFMMFFGYYPIVKSLIDKMRIKVLGYLIKLILFNAAIISAAMAIIYIFHLPDIVSEFGNLGRYTVPVLMGMGNVFFVIYDYAITNVTYAYIHWFRPKVLRRK